MKNKNLSELQEKLIDLFREYGLKWGRVEADVNAVSRSVKLQLHTFSKTEVNGKQKEIRITEIIQ